MKICVYAISKNESKYVRDWVNSMKEADEIYVLDTGSTDDTVKLLKNFGVNVIEKEINFKKSYEIKNEALKLVPIDTDICVYTNLDEFFTKGWRKELEKNWEKDTTKARYPYNLIINDSNDTIIEYYDDRIHKNHNYTWATNVNEKLEKNVESEEKTIVINTIILNHNFNKNKLCSRYTSSLESAIKEKPEDAIKMYFLGIEYIKNRMYKEAIDALKKYLILDTVINKDARATSMRLIGRCYCKLRNPKEAHLWYELAIKEFPNIRDAYVENSMLYCDEKQYAKVEELCIKALQIRNKKSDYINEIFSWDETVYDLLSIATYHLKKFEYALLFINLALEIAPNNNRLINNKIIIEQKNRH